MCLITRAMIHVIKNNTNFITCVKVTKELSPSVFNNIVSDKPMELLWHSVAYDVLFYIFLTFLQTLPSELLTFASCIF
jgi:hypothetical protein